MSTIQPVGPPPTPLAIVLDEEFRTQSGLARATGIDPAEIHRIVNGKHPRQDQAQAIARALHRTVAELGWPWAEAAAA